MKKIIILIFLFSSFGILYNAKGQCPSPCSNQSSSYSALLFTVGGVKISPANVQPNTQYDIRIVYSGTYVSPLNAAYCIVFSSGFNSQQCRDAGSGNATIRITTSSSLPPFGIVGAVGPTDNSGSSSSAMNCTCAQVLIT